MNILPAENPKPQASDVAYKQGILWKVWMRNCCQLFLISVQPSGKLLGLSSAVIHTYVWRLKELAS